MSRTIVSAHVDCLIPSSRKIYKTGAAIIPIVQARTLRLSRAMWLGRVRAWIRIKCFWLHSSPLHSSVPASLSHWVLWGEGQWVFHLCSLSTKHTIQGNKCGLCESERAMGKKYVGWNICVGGKCWKRRNHTLKSVVPVKKLRVRTKRCWRKWRGKGLMKNSAQEEPTGLGDILDMKVRERHQCRMLSDWEEQTRRRAGAKRDLWDARKDIQVGDIQLEV